MNGSSSQGWNLTAFVFTLIVVAILVVGSLWVMYHLNANMMPGVMPSRLTIGVGRRAVLPCVVAPG